MPLRKYRGSSANSNNSNTNQTINHHHHHHHINCTHHQTIASSVPTTALVPKDPPPRVPPVIDPLTLCLDANGTYLCTAYNPRCFIIQKVKLVILKSIFSRWKEKHIHYTSVTDDLFNVELFFVYGSIW